MTELRPAADVAGDILVTGDPDNIWNELPALIEADRRALVDAIVAMLRGMEWGRSQSHYADLIALRFGGTP